MRRTALILALAVPGLAWLGGSALAEDKTVLAKTFGDDVNLFDPKSVTVLEGDTVTFKNDSGKHNVIFKGGSKDGEKYGGDPLTHSPSEAKWTATVSFPNAGTFRYYCSEHADPDTPEFGMWGKVVVKDPNDTKPPRVTDLRAKPKTFCTNKSDDCDKRGTKIKFTLSERAKVTIMVRPDNGKTGRRIFSKWRSAGKRSFDFSGKDMKPGKYILRATARDAAGNKSPVATANIKVEQ
jgi:plastocyanin